MSSVFLLQRFKITQERVAQRVGTDALLLGAWSFSHPLPKTARLLDVGTGTGIVALMLAQRFPESSVEAWEMEPNALLDAEENFRTSPFASRLKLRAQDYMEVQTSEETPFDLIISNPPYYTEGILPEDHRLSLARHVAEGLFGI